MKNFIDRVVEVVQIAVGIILAVFLIVFIAFVVTHQPVREVPFEGNLLPGWDCTTPMALSSGALPNTVLVAYRTSRGEWVYKQFGQTSLKKDKPFFSENCPQGIPLPEQK